jgi:prepilin-type N-terminal cleavage/methylation domain-containing protein
MTSNTGPKKKARRGSGRRTSGGIRQAIQAPRPRRGFTLLEVVLVLGILAMLLGVAVVSLSALRAGHTLEQGAERLQTALRLARADAANRGRRLRLTFDAETTRPAVAWEPDPLEAPGEFVDYAAVCTWRHLLEIEGVWVDRCEFTGASAYRYVDDAGAAGQAVADPEALAPITFEPDGSSDSVVLHLVTAEDPEGRIARIELHGLTGRVHGQILTPEELDELEELLAQPPEERVQP